MTDRELLEHAARAAGYEWKSDIAKWRNERGILGLWIKDVSTYWNPLEDDGHALCLAVKLNIDVQFNTDPDEQTTTAIAPSPERRYEGWTFTEGWSSGKEAATRRAIVSAAASMEKQA